MALRAAAAGVDTWAPAWRVQTGSVLARALEARASLPSAAGGRMVPERVRGHRILFWPASGLLKAEGHPNEHGLAPVTSLPGQLAELEEAMCAAGVPVPPGSQRFARRDSYGYAGVRRLDLTVDLRADDTGEGRRTLAAVEAAARGSGHHAPTYGRKGKAGATVYIAGDRGVFGRWYDKGAESGQAAPYRLIRPEAQWRFRDTDTPELSELADPRAMRDRFARRWGAWCRGRIVVGDMTDLGRELARAVDERRITPSEARRIAGYLVMEPHGLAGVPARTRTRLRTEAGKFGFHLVDGVLEPLEVELGEVLEEAEQLEIWESGAIARVEKPDPSRELNRDMARRLSEKRPR